MKKKKNSKTAGRLIAFYLSLLPLVMYSGCSKSENKACDSTTAASQPDLKLPECSGGLVMKIDSEVITCDEIIAPAKDDLKQLAKKTSFDNFEAQARPALKQILMNKVSNIVLYSQARKKSVNDINDMLDKAVESEIKKFTADFGNNYAEADKNLRQMGMDWQSFREYQRRLILTQSYLSEQLGEEKPVTYSDLKSLYEQMKNEHFAIVGKTQFRLIDIQPQKQDINDVNSSDPQQLKARSMELADGIISGLNSGQDFAELAKEYSDDHKAAVGGLWEPISSGSLAPPYDVVETEIAKLQPGQVAGPIESQDHIFIVKLESRVDGGFEPFEKVQKTVEARLTFNRRREAIDNMIAKLMARTDMGDIERFLDYCVRKAYYQ